MAMIRINDIELSEREVNCITEYAWEAVRVYKIPVECYGEHITNMYLIIDGEITLIDAALNTEQAMTDLLTGLATINREFGIRVGIADINHVVITHGHADHWGMLSNEKFRGKKVYVHEFDTRFIKDFSSIRVNSRGRINSLIEESGWNLSMDNLFSLDGIVTEPQECELIELKEGQRIINGYDVYHVPGHSPGHICLKVGPVLFLGDLILSQTTPLQIPGSMLEGCGLKLYLISLRRIGGIGENLGLPAHEATIYAVSDRVVEMEAFHYKRLLDISGVCAQEKNLFKITDEYYQLRPETLNGRTVADLSRDEQILALEEIKAHIEYLIDDDHMTITGVENGVVKYRAK